MILESANEFCCNSSFVFCTDDPDAGRDGDPRST